MIVHHFTVQIATAGGREGYAGPLQTATKPVIRK